MRRYFYDQSTVVHVAAVGATAWLGLQTTNAWLSANAADRESPQSNTQQQAMVLQQQSVQFRHNALVYGGLTAAALALTVYSWKKV